MMRAYEPGKRWQAFGFMVVEAELSPSGKQWTMAICEIGTDEQRKARARLIAESPLRDELLHDIALALSDAALDGSEPYGEWHDLRTRIRDTLARTEG